MRILHLGHVPVPQNHPQAARLGIQHPGRWVLNHALAQKAAGLDVEVISQAHKASCDFDCQICGVTVHFLRTFHSYRHLTFYALDGWRMARLARRLKPDIVHAHGTEAAYGHAAVRSGLPFCITAQGLYFKIIPTLGRPPTWDERFLGWGENMVWKKTKFAVAKSRYGEDALRSRYPLMDVSLIYNAYDLELERSLSKKDGRRVAFVGGISNRKGFHFLVPLASRMASDSSFEIHVAGNGPEGGSSRYENEQISRLRDILGSRLVLHGRLSASEVFSLLDNCRVIVAPSLEEMSGNQVTEGIMRGCHAVVFDKTGVAGIVQRVGNGSLVPWGDAERFADSVVQVLESPPSRQVMETARKNVAAIMSPSVVAAKHLTLYRRILSGSVSDVKPQSDSSADILDRLELLGK